MLKMWNNFHAILALTLDRGACHSVKGVFCNKNNAVQNNCENCIFRETRQNPQY